MVRSYQGRNINLWKVVKGKRTWSPCFVFLCISWSILQMSMLVKNGTYCFKILSNCWWSSPLPMIRTLSTLTAFYTTNVAITSKRDLTILNSILRLPFVCCLMFLNMSYESSQCLLPRIPTIRIVQHLLTSRKRQWILFEGSMRNSALILFTMTHTRSCLNGSPKLPR